MKRKALTLSALIMAATFLATPSHASPAEYDPQHTVLALNMAVVSVQRILATNDRAVLEMEYSNIEAAGKLQANYDEWAKNNLFRSVLSLSGIIQGTISESATDAGMTAAENLISKGFTFGLSAGFTTLSSAFPPSAI